MQAVLQSLERQHEEEKRSALERQRQMYELELQQLRKKLNPERLSGPPPVAAQQGHYRSMERLSVGGTGPASSAQTRLRQWTEDRCSRVCVCVCVSWEAAAPHGLLLLLCAPSGRWCW